MPGEVTSRRSPNIATLSNIAEIVNISEIETLRCFKKITGESPIQYLLKYRLIRSASVLTEYPDKNISIVAEECGFDSPAYYTKKFKEFYFCSPREYRQVHQAVF
ncbi:helix-turn-helix transcriptional regulator [Mediterraneibacter gnavus]|uniref:helix-turn-helix transcriptional regulator n=1 Tax=Mediterraneibacter gnavus TaxID=33038 RepID=UPI0035A090E9